MRRIALPPPRGPATARQELWLATAALGTYNYASLGLFSLVPAIRPSLHLSPREVGLLASAQFAFAALVTFPAARLSDRFAPGRVVAASQVTVIVASATAATAHSLPILLLASAILGLASAIVNPVTNVLSLGGMRAERRALAMSIKQTSVTIAGALAGSTLPALAAITNWRFALILPVVAAVAVGFWAMRTPPRVPPRPLVLEHDGPCPPRVRIAIYGLVMSGVQFAVFGYLTLYLVDSRGFSPTTAGVGFAVALAGGAVGRVTWGAISDALATRITLLATIGAGSAIALSLLAIAPGILIWPALLLLGLLSVGWNGVFHTMVAEHAGTAGVARASAFAFVFIYAGAIAVPPALGYAVDAFSWRTFWWAAAAPTAAAATLMGAHLKQRRQSSAIAEPGARLAETPES